MPEVEIPIASIPEDPPVKSWFVYLVRAANGALYCGISTDPHRRFIKHQSGKGARFFSSSPAMALVYVEACRDKGDALRQERLIKKLRKSAKECLATSYIQPSDAAPSA
ncbi:GIY-YIG nuclease family protein [Pseudomonas sp. KU26590]|uniref:GIY-YIG nuclease family protein n=1 Tax=Pseudomonas sp. KU26590 TaxID=2991051 RepID=UPI00223DED0B|nr:GIY-YIG nuclease family protein [Pseudomonas sp. KU26590]UZJ61319.1 GIY-YIG nuclease family protein [Pseudomonas sp. KU26590]